MLRIPGIPTWAVGVRFGRRHGRKLGGIGLTEEDEARSSEFGGHIGVFFCGPAQLFQKAAALMIRVAGGVTAKVLEEKRDAGEWPVGQLRRFGLVTRFLEKRRDDGVEPWVDVLNTGNGGVY